MDAVCSSSVMALDDDDGGGGDDDDDDDDCLKQTKCRKIEATKIHPQRIHLKGLPAVDLAR